MKQLRVNLPQERGYAITMERGLLGRCGSELRKVSEAKQVCVVTDSNVAPLYGETVLRSLREAGFAAKLLVFPAGENSKNMDTLIALYDGMLAPEPFSLTRGGLIVALGGGVTGDMAGFAAATLFRGIPFVQIPTTLLAQVDSSVGGKVAVDLKQGKNLAGAFYQPRAVLIDPDTLDTLPDRVFFDGLSEVIKYGVLGNRGLFETVESCAGREELSAKIEEIIAACCADKRAFVEQDERDTGERMRLNFGHTLGHVYEKWGRYETYLHGEAVACGMVRILEIGEQQGVTAPGTAARVEMLLRRFGLPTHADGIPESVFRELLGYDKKSMDATITVVLAKEIGESFLQQLPQADFAAWACERSQR